MIFRRSGLLYFLYLFPYCRCCSSTVSDVPTPNDKTQRFSYNNPGFQGGQENSRDKEPVYSEIPAVQHPYENHNVGFANNHYLPLDIVKGKSEPAYASLHQTELQEIHNYSLALPVWLPFASANASFTSMYSVIAQQRILFHKYRSVEPH